MESRHLINVPITIGLHFFYNRILNASGCWCKSIDQLRGITNNPLFSGIVSKTCGLNPFDGNPEPNLYMSDTLNPKDGMPEFVLNCMGLPNNGFDYYCRHFAQFKIFNDKPYILSLNGANLSELLEMLKKYNDIIIEQSQLSGCTPQPQLVEINLSCPNILDKSIIIGYHSDLVDDICNCIEGLNLSYIEIGFKLPPYLERANLESVIKTIIKYTYRTHIKFIVCCNAIPNGMILNNEGIPILSADYGAISFSNVNKLIGISNVYQTREIINQYMVIDNLGIKEIIKIIGCGGIRTFQDAKDYIDAGADLVQIGSNLIMNL